MYYKLTLMILYLLGLNACSFPMSEKKTESLDGKYILVEGKSLYDSFTFKGKSTVIIESIGMEFVTSYVIDEQYLRIEAQPSNILLKTESKGIIIGEGFASGIYMQESVLEHYKDSLSRNKESTKMDSSDITSGNKRTIHSKTMNDQKKSRAIETKKKEEIEKEQSIRNKVPGAFGMGGAEGNSQGDATSGTGNQGSPFGNSDHGANEGVGGYGSFNLNGRSIGAGGLPRPAYTIQEEGRIVINITVDPKGNVIFAEIGRGTNIDNASMRKSALEAARRAKFNSITGANNQSGSITYVYKFK